MRDRWHELLEALAEELFGPSGQGSGGAGAQDGGQAPGLLPRALAGPVPGRRQGAAETWPEGGSEGRLAPMAAPAEQRSGGQSWEVDWPGGGSLSGALWPAWMGQASGGGTELSASAEVGRPAHWAGRPWERGAGAVPWQVLFPGTVDPSAVETVRMGETRLRSEAASVTAEELDRAFQRDARRYDGELSMY